MKRGGAARGIKRAHPEISNNSRVLASTTTLRLCCVATQVPLCFPRLAHCQEVPVPQRFLHAVPLSYG